MGDKYYASAVYACRDKASNPHELVTLMKLSEEQADELQSLDARIEKEHVRLNVDIPMPSKPGKDVLQMRDTRRITRIKPLLDRRQEVYGPTEVYVSPVGAIKKGAVIDSIPPDFIPHEQAELSDSSEELVK